MIRVKATRLGYFGGKRIYPDQVFVLESEAQLSKKWMEKIGGEAAPAEKSEKGKPASEASKAAPKGKASTKKKSKGKKAI